jgi:tetratricopeptide (TPR) repeat protein
MKRAGWRWLFVLLAGCVLVTAAGPDDQFIRIYSMIQEGDTLFANGRRGDAQERYREALTLLLQFEKDYPRWNDQIVNFRKQYLQERAGTAATTPSTPATSSGAVAKAPDDPRVAALQEEMGQLRAERDRLQSKLREALAAQPAALDPRELARAEETLASLRKENETLRTEITAREQQRELAESPTRIAEATKELEEARQNLARQSETVASLTRRNESLTRELKDAAERAAQPADPSVARKTQSELDAARQQVVELQARAGKLQSDFGAERQRAEQYYSEKVALEKRVAELGAKKAEPVASEDRNVAASRQQVAQLKERLEKTEKELTAERDRTGVFKAERDALERRLAELTARKSPEPAQPAETAAAPAAPKAPETAATPGPKEEKAMAKYQREVDRIKIHQLERERDDQNKRLRVMTRQLEDFRRQTGATNTATGTDQLAILRARIEAYEARAVPYTPEELTLMKQSAGVSTAPESAGNKRSLRQVPAGAATLLAEAQRAFQVRRYDEAERKFQQALQLDERNVDMLTYLAAVQLEQDRLADAEATLARALAVDPNSPDGVSLMGLLRFRQAKYDEAFDLLSRAAQLNPDNPYTQNYLGVTLSQRGQRKPAETALRRAIALDANYGEAHANLAAVYALAQPPFLELARFHYQKSLALGQPKNAEVERLLSGGAAPAPAGN